MFHTYVVRLCSKCLTLQQTFYLDIAYVAVAIHICSKYFSCFKRMLQVLYLDIAYVGYTHMLQAYVSNVSPVSDVFWSKCFYVASVFTNRRAR
jgi:hypothetical protein